MLFAKSMKQGFGARVIAYDVYQSDEVKALGISYVPLDQLYAEADIISLHVPLLPSTKNMVRLARKRRFWRREEIEREKI